MTTATVSSKGQITIPANARQDLSGKAGARVAFVQIEPGQYLVVATNRSVTELKGMFGTVNKTVTIEDMNRAIAARGAAAP